METATCNHTEQAIETQVTLAKEALDNLEYTAAAERLNKTIGMFQSSASAYRKVGLLLAQVGRELAHSPSLERAHTFLHKAIEMQPLECQNWIALADCYRESEEREKAVAVLQQALSVATDKLAVYEALLEIKQEEDESKEALALLEQMQKLAPQNLDYRHRYAKLLKERGDEKEALEHYGTIVGSGADRKSVV